MGMTEKNMQATYSGLYRVFVFRAYVCRIFGLGAWDFGLRV